MDTHSKTPDPTALEIEQLHAFVDGALDDASSEAIEELRRSDNALDDSLRELESLNCWVHSKMQPLAPGLSLSSNEAAQALKRFHNARSPVPLEPTTTQATQEPSNAWWLGWRWSFGLAGLALLLMIPMSSSWWDSSSSHHGASSRDLLRKGAQPVVQMLHAYQRQGAAVKSWGPASFTQDGTRLAPGDLVQFRFKLKQDMHILVVSLNERGEVFPFVPLQGTQSTHVTAGVHLFPKHQRSLELDDTIGYERFFLLSSTKPFSLRQVKKTLLRQWSEQGRNLTQWKPRDNPWFVETVLVRKVVLQAVQQRRLP